MMFNIMGQKIHAPYLMSQMVKFPFYYLCLIVFSISKNSFYTNLYIFMPLFPFFPILPFCSKKKNSSILCFLFSLHILTYFLLSLSSHSTVHHRPPSVHLTTATVRRTPQAPTSICYNGKAFFFLK